MNNTKRNLLTSVLSLLLCCTMLLGTTLAWFTDSAISSDNKIQAGTLDVKLLMYDGDEYKDISTNSNPIFGTSGLAQNERNTLWEPGKTQVAYLEIRNNGNLDLKYNVVLDVMNQNKDLYKVMKYDIIEDATNGNPVREWNGGLSVDEGTNLVTENVKLEAGASHFFALAIHMDDTAGNEYQGGEVLFDITVLATQLSSEEDSFGNQYDKDATFDKYYGSAKLPVKVENKKLTEQVTRNVGTTIIELPAGTMVEDGTTEVVVTIDNETSTPEGLTIANYKESQTLGINVAGLDDGNEAFVKVALKDFAMEPESVYHGITAMSKLQTGTSTVNEEAWYYDEGSKTLYIWAKSFSPFTVVTNPCVSDNAELEKLFKDGGKITLERDYQIDNTLKVASGKTVTLDLNGYTIEGYDTKKSGNFELIMNEGTLKIQGEGTIRLKAYHNRFWNAASSVVVNHKGKLTINGPRLIHDGGADMAYAVDNRTNGGTTPAITTIENGVIKSSYRAIRLFANGVDAKCKVVVKGGKVYGTNSGIWIQNPLSGGKSAKATLKVYQNAQVNKITQSGVSTDFKITLDATE